MAQRWTLMSEAVTGSLAAGLHLWAAQSRSDRVGIWCLSRTALWHGPIMGPCAAASFVHSALQACTGLSLLLLARRPTYFADCSATSQLMIWGQNF